MMFIRMSRLVEYMYITVFVVVVLILALISFTDLYESIDDMTPNPLQNRELYELYSHYKNIQTSLQIEESSWTMLSRSLNTKDERKRYKSTNKRLKGLLNQSNQINKSRKDHVMKRKISNSIYRSEKLSDGSILCIDESYNICSNLPNVFINYIYNIFKNVSYDEIISFNGHSVKRDFDPHGLAYGLLLNGRSGQRWSHIAHLINQSYELQHKKGFKTVHVHNELKFGDLLQLLIHQHQFMFKRPPKTYSDLVNAFDLGQPPIVMTNSVDENWGFLSTPINTRTTKWINMTNHLLIHGANYQMAKDFLSLEKLILMVISNHVDPMIGTHPKLIGLPLGISKKSIIYRKINEFRSKRINKTKLFSINNSGWKERSTINQQVAQIFDNKITNSYHNRGNRDHYHDASQSLFVLAPSGLGFDTYRLWETLLLGSIPVVESNQGFDRTYSNLPVLVVKNYSDLSISLLIDAYKCIHSNAHRYEYRHLLTRYWKKMIDKTIRDGSIVHVLDNHPYCNKYCDFLSYEG